MRSEVGWAIRRGVSSSLGAIHRREGCVVYVLTREDEAEPSETLRGRAIREQVA